MIDREQKLRILRALVRPIAKFCLKHSLPVHDLEEAFRVEFIERAAEELRHKGEKVNASRLSVITGVYRKEVDRIFVKKDLSPPEPQSILHRVVGQWEQNARFQTPAGKPRPLSFKGGNCEFVKLVSSVTTAIGPAAVLFELERRGLVKRGRKGLVLVKGGNVIDDNLAEGYELVARDIGTLLEAADENLMKTDPLGNVHVRTEFDNVFRASVPAVRQWLHSQAKAFHKRARTFLAKMDKDISTRAERGGEAGARVVLTSVSHIELRETPQDVS